MRIQKGCVRLKGKLVRRLEGAVVANQKVLGGSVRGSNFEDGYDDVRVCLQNSIQLSN